MAVYLCPVSTILQFFTDTGIILAGGKVNTYLAGTSTPTSTYTDATGSTPNANPIILNAAGRLPNVQVWQLGGVNLKVVLTDANNNQIGTTYDQISGLNDPASTLAGLSVATTGSGADLVANAMRSFDLFSAVRLWTPTTLAVGQTLVISIQGGTGVNDGLGGLFYYAASSAVADDAINIIKPNVGSGNGRFIRLYPGVSGQTFVGTLTGMSGTVTGTINYKIDSRSMVTLQSGAITGTSNTTAMTLTGLPAAIIPSTLGSSDPCLVEDNGVANLMGWGTVNTGGVVTFGLGANPNTSGFTNTGVKGLPSGWTLTYPLT